ncbi:acyltransferase family protein [Novosphingobium aquimarinum]|uniref:acyltransferase family protein n=1 Tax=Novosphingobium aquimarinum TaxID=2682494 RepID=UPI0012EB2CB1|nr:acyltransferase [Novosphingobium aquimarinum]
MSESAQKGDTGGMPNLDHLRWIAALAVAFQHARALVMVDYHPGAGLVGNAVFFAAGFSHEAVIVFFVLSGYLVGGKALRLLREGSTRAQRQRFVQDRFVRIALVLWPALLLTAVIAAIAPSSAVLTTAGWSADLVNIVADSTAPGWAATSVMLNEILVPTVPYNDPLWSLAYEWTYYVLAAAAVFLFARDRSILGLIVVVYAAALLALVAWNCPLLLWMMLYWLAGAFVAGVPGLRMPWLTGGVFCLVLMLSRFDQPAGMSDICVAAATALLIADRAFRSGRVASRLAGWLASFSFSLYVVHWPIMLLLVAWLQSFGYVEQRLPEGIAAYALIILLVGVSYAGAIGFAWATEARTDAVRGWMRRRNSTAAGQGPVRVP